MLNINFTGTPLLTYNASSLVLPTSANIQVVAGDTMEIISLGSGNWKVFEYNRLSGASLVNANLTGPVTSVGNTTTITNNAATYDILDNDGELAIVTAFRSLYNY